jgi:hypothetical protein
MSISHKHWLKKLMGDHQFQGYNVLVAIWFNEISENFGKSHHSDNIKFENFSES